MGWKGTVRSVRAAYRASERDKVRAIKAHQKEQQQYEKMIAVEDAREEFEAYQEYCCLLKSFHGSISNATDWQKILSIKEPSKPKKYKKHERTARESLQNYKPNFLDKVFKREEKKKSKLTLNLEKGVEQDKSDYEIKVSEWQKSMKDWEKQNKFAQRMQQDEFEAKIEALENYFDCSEMEELGVKVSFMKKDNEVRITVQSAGIDVVPNEVKTLLQSGKLSTKKIPVGKYYELYQDHLCSVVLKCAGEFFSMISDERIFIDVMDELLDMKTGHKDLVPVLSVCISRSTFESLNLKRVDPSDCMVNFIHNMSFKKTKGFEKVRLVEID